MANGHQATLRQLLSHTSGIPKLRPRIEPPWNDPTRWSWRDQLERVLGKAAIFEPGTSAAYANTNFLLLAMILDGLTGSHSQALSTRVFEPLGMTETYYKDEPELPHPPGLVHTYFDRHTDGRLENMTETIDAVVFNTHYGWAGVIASLDDYATFIEALLGGELVSAESLAEMKINHIPDRHLHSGLGLVREPSPDPEVHGYGWGHAARGLAGRSMMYHFPDSGVTICYAANLGAHDWDLTAPVVAFDDLWSEITEAVFAHRLAVRPPQEQGRRAARAAAAGVPRGDAGK
jgi:D-alanyl-D-alanine carboxypeptidase